MNDDLAGKTVRVMLKNGDSYLAQGFRVDGKTATFMNLPENSTSSSHFVEIDAALISEVVHRRRGKGAWQGLLIGAATGAASGAALGATTTTEDCTGDALCDIGRGGWATIGAVIFTVPGALLGVTYGASVGAKDRYVEVDPD